MTFLTNQDVLVYTYENITQNALDSETANGFRLLKKHIAQGERHMCLKASSILIKLYS